MAPRHTSPATYGHIGLTTQFATGEPSTISPPPDPVRHQLHRTHPSPAPLPPRIAHTAQGHTFAPSELSAHFTYSSAPAQRREGRTVPTNSDIFKRELSGKETPPEAVDSVAGGGALGVWAKQHEVRSTAGAMEARLANGHANGTAKENSQLPVTEKVPEKTTGRFPGLSEYLGGPRNEMGGGAFTGVGKVGNILSPPRMGAVMGGLGGNSCGVSAGNADVMHRARIFCRRWAQCSVGNNGFTIMILCKI